MVQRRSEILPARNVIAGIVGREQQHQHIEQAECAGTSNQNTRYERKSNRQLSISDDERYRPRMRQNYFLEDWDHERKRSAALHEVVDPPFEAAMQGELRSKYFVLGED